jgi:hypothetical protein
MIDASYWIKHGIWGDQNTPNIMEKTTNQDAPIIILYFLRGMYDHSEEEG